MSKQNLFPLSLYEYTRDGRYAKPVIIDSEVELQGVVKTIVQRAIDERREVRITDAGDFLVFHAFDGLVAWDGQTRRFCLEWMSSPDTGEPSSAEPGTDQLIGDLAGDVIQDVMDEIGARDALDQVGEWLDARWWVPSEQSQVDKLDPLIRRLGFNILA
ncbi:MAG: hypothetical protein ACREDR_00100 [Blastocatellia bacterium]